MNRGTAYNIGYTVRCRSPKYCRTSYSQSTLEEMVFLNLFIGGAIC